MIGLIGKKVGMTQVFDEKGRVTPVTVIQVDTNTVVGLRTPDVDGYSAVVLGAGTVKDKHVTKPVKGQFEKNSVAPTRQVMELRDCEGEYKLGDSLGLDLLNDVTFVDVVGTSKGKGTAGVMKRWGFGGGRATHGSKFHRENGSTGQATYPGKTLKGLKMSGRLGAERVTVQNLQVVKIDSERNLLLVKGAVPGSRNSSVVVKRAVKKG